MKKGDLAVVSPMVIAWPMMRMEWRRVNEQEAIIVRRIFAAFTKGETPGAIATALNHEVIPGLAGRPWAASTIRGHKARGTGILNNELYRGVLIWNRLGYHEKSETGNRQARRNPDTDWVTTDVPSPHIIEGPLWQAAKSRQQEIKLRYKRVSEGVQTSKESGARGVTASASNFYRLLICAQCGGDFAM
ncbi:recombinase family protein [Sinorhizobium psoraleae]|uniref:Recombinase family protein n=1 Tax=Sinorhizobium psoraleae TaxID=520838 RepID=A0ABT4KA71_9HYPH|nr:recombinase family protein [Sinorhizobium psoraleae]MCZ4088817.1 recombinase family protein [Sinorhizobium psoraleae]